MLSRTRSYSTPPLASMDRVVGGERQSEKKKKKCFFFSLKVQILALRECPRFVSFERGCQEKKIERLRSRRIFLCLRDFRGFFIGIWADFFE